MALDPKRLMRDAKQAQATQPGTAIGRETTGVTRAVRESYEVIGKLRAAGVSWSAIARAMSEQGISQSGGQPLTATRLTAIVGDVKAKMRRSVEDLELRAQRTDLVSEGYEGERASVEPPMTPPRPQGSPPSHLADGLIDSHPSSERRATEAEIRRAGLADLKRILRKE